VKLHLQQGGKFEPAKTHIEETSRYEYAYIKAPRNSHTRRKLRRLFILFLAFAICIGLITYPPLAAAELNIPIEEHSIDIDAPTAICGTPNFHEFNLATAPLPRLSMLGEFEPAKPIVVGESISFWAQDSWYAEDGADNDGDVLIDEFDESMYSLLATVQRVGTHCYVVVEDGQSVSDSNLDYVMNQFDNTIYPTDIAAFGSEPNVDGDSKIFILLMNIRDQNYHDPTYPYYIAGYFWSLHEYSNSALPPPYSGYSNEKEIVHIDLNPGNVATCEGTIAHEFQHMIHWNQDSNEETWVDEGCADLAEFLCYSTHPMSHVNAFTNDADVQLTTWGGSGSTLLAHYGASYLFMLYLYEKYGGGSTIKAIVQDSANGITGIESHLAGATFSTAFTRWTVANRIDDTSIGPSPFYYGYMNIDIEASLSPNSDHSTYPYSRSTNVNYWAADYVRFTGGTGTLTLGFDGDDANVFKVEVIKATGAGSNTLEEIPLDTTQQGTLMINDFGTTYTSVILVPSSQSQAGGKSYQYSASISGAPPPPGPSTPFFHPHTEFWFTWYDLTGPITSEIGYDDGSEEGYVWWTIIGHPTEGPISAVRFTSSVSSMLKAARFSIHEGGSFKVRVMDSARRNIVTPISQTVSSPGWYELDLRSYRITVAGDFYVGVEWVTSSYPKLHVDQSSPDGRSWAYDGVSWSLKTGYDYMIRAVLQGTHYGADIDNIHFVNPSGSSASVSLTIGPASSPLVADSFTLAAGEAVYKNYPGVIGGPVHITSSQPIWTTQRIVGWNSFKEVPGLPGDMASTEIYYTWYDMKYADWDAIHFLNPSPTSTAHLSIYIEGQLMPDCPISIPSGGGGFTYYLNTIGGPVRIVSDIPIFSTQRVVGWSDFDEIVGMPSWYCFKEHWFNWYDRVGASIDNIHFINLGTSTANIEVYIGGVLRGGYTLGAGQASFVNYPGLIGGPVRVVSDQSIWCTQRIVGWSGFKEEFSVPTELMSTKWFFNWYDKVNTQIDNIHFLNPGTSDAHITVTIAGTSHGSYTIPAGGADYVFCLGVCNGPVIVDSDVPIMTSQRIVGWGSFEETIGIQWS